MAHREYGGGPLPMPLHERFAKGTQWVQTEALNGHPAHTKVTIDSDLSPNGNEDLTVWVLYPDTTRGVVNLSQLR